MSDLVIGVIMATLIIVHGEKLTSTGEISYSFKQRLDLAYNLSKRYDNSTIIVAGGHTRKKFPTEAYMGEEYLKNKGLSQEIILENKSRSTVENILFIKKHVKENNYNKIIVVSSKKHIPRVKYLYWRLWPSAYKKAEFDGSKDDYPFIAYGIELIKFESEIIDPDESGPVIKFLKKTFRNAQG